MKSGDQTYPKMPATSGSRYEGAAQIARDITREIAKTLKQPWTEVNVAASRKHMQLNYERYDLIPRVDLKQQIRSTTVLKSNLCCCKVLKESFLFISFAAECMQYFIELIHSSL